MRLNMKLYVDVADAGPNWGASASGDIIRGTVAATGLTRSAAISKFKSALRFHLDGLREDGHDVPRSADIVLCFRFEPVPVAVG